MTDDPTPTLRDRLRDAMLTDLRASRPDAAPDPDEERAAGDLANAVLPVVEAETAALRERAEAAEAEVAQWRKTVRTYAHNEGEQRKRAEEAEAALAAAIRQTEAHADIRRQREIQRDQAERQRDEARLVAASLADNGPEHLATIERAEQAEQQRDAALAALRDLTDGRPCAPHPGNGWCQTHGERAPCPHAEAGRLLAARDAEKPEETTPAEHTPGANAEDCPACSGRRDLPYPFICPGAALDQPEET